MFSLQTAAWWLNAFALQEHLNLLKRLQEGL